jgi:hypothetical protein
MSVFADLRYTVAAVVIIAGSTKLLFTKAASPIRQTEHSLFAHLLSRGTPIVAITELGFGASLLWSNSRVTEYPCLVFCLLLPLGAALQRRHLPDANCGCFGELSTQPLTSRGRLRLYVLVGCMVLVASSPSPNATFSAACAAMVFGAIFVGLSRDELATFTYRLGSPRRTRDARSGALYRYVMDHPEFSEIAPSLITDMPESVHEHRSGYTVVFNGWDNTTDAYRPILVDVRKAPIRGFCRLAVLIGPSRIPDRPNHQ